MFALFAASAMVVGTADAAVSASSRCVCPNAAECTLDDLIPQTTQYTCGGAASVTANGTLDDNVVIPTGKLKAEAEFFEWGGRLTGCEVNDVVRHLVIAPGNKDFLAADQVVITLLNGFGRYSRQIGTCCGLGQTHRAGPFTADHIRYICTF